MSILQLFLVAVVQTIFRLSGNIGRLSDSILLGNQLSMFWCQSKYSTIDVIHMSNEDTQLDQSTIMSKLAQELN